MRLSEGYALGFRRGPDSWVAKFRDRTGKRHYRALLGCAEYDEAKQSADRWVRQLSSAATRSVRRDTVRVAAEGYLADLRRHGREDAADAAEVRFKQVLYEDRFASLPLERIKQDDVLEWRDRLLPRRQPRTVNRHVRAVVAALNWAIAHGGFVGNAAAWKLKPLADEVEEEGDTAVFLDVAQRKALMAAAPRELADFLRGLELTGARPGELAQAVAGDFDGSTLKLRHRKGRPPRWKSRFVVLDAAGIAHFRAHARDKLPGAPLFTEDGEQPWRRHSWSRGIKLAISAANENLKGDARIPTNAVAYSFRHARISELLQVHGVDPVTVAQQTGTSLAIIEKNYFRFIESSMREKLAAIKSS